MNTVSVLESNVRKHPDKAVFVLMAKVILLRKC
jgi:hypothetical protein